MFTVKNPGQFPVIIRDLNLHVAGGKEVDLDSLFSRDTIERSVNLERLIKYKKIVIVEQEKVEKKPNQSVVKKVGKDASGADPALLLELRKDILEVKDLIRSGSFFGGSGVCEEPADPETEEKLNKLRVHNLSKDNYEVETNFENIGKITEKEEALGDLLDTLDALEGE